jgi:hypothetical protein
MIFRVPEIHHSKEGYEPLVSLWAEYKDCFFETIELDLRTAQWIDADMCAAIGAILYRLGQNINTINLKNIPESVEKTLSRNGFLSFYGREKIPDYWGSSIPYHRFDRKDDKFFAGYIERELIQRKEIPTMSPGLVKKFRESVFEIFSNAVLHSHTQHGIFSCGQFFPNRQRINFSVTDLGIGIRRNVNEITGGDLSAVDAITWATEGNNTTKRGNIPGGLGLKILKEFIDLNGGCIQIVSDDGFWMRAKNKTIAATLSKPFPGTAVNIEINTADTQSYKLFSEILETDVF